MSGTRKPRNRLEALLTGLENEVLQMEDSAAISPDEDGAAMDIGELRFSMESVVASALDVTERRRESLHRAGEGPRGTVARALELLGRWEGVKQDESRPSRVPQVRMAFSGKRESTGGETNNRQSRRSRRGTESEDKES